MGPAYRPPEVVVEIAKLARVGSESLGSDLVRSDLVRSDLVRSDLIESDLVGSDPDDCPMTAR